MWFCTVSVFIHVLVLIVRFIIFKIVPVTLTIPALHSQKKLSVSMTFQMSAQLCLIGCSVFQVASGVYQTNIDRTLQQECNLPKANIECFPFYSKTI